MDELVKRYRTLYNESLPVGWEGDLGVVITQGLLQKKIIKNPDQAKIETKKLEKFDVVLVDEVEYTINPSGAWIYDRVKNASHMYGFSGSADKYKGECLSFQNGITGTIMDNAGLIKYFGPSLVHRMPVANEMNDVAIKTLALDFLEFGENEVNDEDNVYVQLLTAMWTNPSVVEAITKVIQAYPKLYIPVNNLENIINTWVEYWKGKFRILVICHAGYMYTDLAGNTTNLTLEEACEMMDKGLIDVIPSTSSGFRALDFPGLNNILLVAGKNAGTVLQTVGRTARQKVMNIIHLEPKKFKMIPVYTKGTKHRLEMLHDYYRYCKINKIVRNIEDL